jgi:UDP-glucuronate decarboxylase
MARVLVTGGAGFIGASLCHEMLRRGDDVTCLDNFSSGSRANVAALLDDSRFSLREHDVTVPYDAECDTIINLACPASPPQYQRDPIGTLLTCVLGARNALDLAWANGARVFQASTSEIYGSPLVHPQDESYWGHVNPVGPRSCYDEGKRCAETLFYDYHRQNGVDTRVARIFNTYGPHMSPSDGRVVSTFIVEALRGEPITIFGDGLQTRSFCYVDDLVDGILALVRSDVTSPVNLGNPVECTMLELAQAVLDITGSRSRIVHAPLPEDDPRQRRPDITLAMSTLGWRPSIELRDGLERTIAYFDGVLRNETAPA